MDVTNSGFSKFHPILLIGYGDDKNGGYWILKNSFGTKWGENGYMRLRIGKDGKSDPLNIQNS